MSPALIKGWVIVCVAGAVGSWVGYSLAIRTLRTNAIQQECAHYDPRTGEFKWGPLQ